MKDTKKKKLAGKMGVVCILITQTNGENAKIMKAFLLFNHKSNTAPIKNNQNTFIIFIVIKLGHTFRKKDIIKG